MPSHQKANKRTENRIAGIKVLDLDPHSPALQAGLRAGDRLISLNGQPVVDQLDLVYYLDEEESLLQVERNGAVLSLHLQIPAGEFPGWVLEPLDLRSCHCNCIFCFIEQLPPGLRESLYIKDEDYRFSFIFGNYLTLVGLHSRDYQRIFDLRLSPLYVSIHATDPAVRGRLLGIGNAPILPHLKRLISGHIQLHGQIVLVPGINDGEVLENTLKDLSVLHPGLVSLSIVPVGLTKHRAGLPALRLLTGEEAKNVMQVIRHWQQRMLREYNTRWVFPADELLLSAGEEIPPDDFYEDYPQIENGVGMLRSLLDSAADFHDSISDRSVKERRLLWVTGKSAGPILKGLAERFSRRVAGLHIDVLEVENRLFGATVTVAGLLGGKDMDSALRRYFEGGNQTADVVFLPPDCLNDEGLMLDDWTPEKIADHLHIPVRIHEGSWEKMILGGAPV